MQNDLLRVLLDMRNGQVASDCNTHFDELVKAVIETGEKGEMTIKLLVAPSKKAMGGAVVEVETEHDVKIKKPRFHVGKSVFFVTSEGTLSRNDPAQEAMFALEEPAQEKENQHGR